MRVDQRTDGGCPDRVLGDKAYSSKANRVCLRRREIKATIDQPRDQAGHRKAKGSEGGRAPTIDKQIHRRRHAAVRYQATGHVAAIKSWLRHIGNTR
ncbi:hypothetical protein [Saccharothrix sp. NRRL B-16348]|uniref:hypothetical protein n=1 Tax=Saccharothrix sp. NRRL B-16348 TaxID=1415542 RepID=UPI0012FB4197